MRCAISFVQAAAGGYCRSTHWEARRSADRVDYSVKEQGNPMILRQTRTVQRYSNKLQSIFLAAVRSSELSLRLTDDTLWHQNLVLPEPPIAHNRQT